MKKLRMAIVGCGNIAGQHKSRFEPINDIVEVTALADIDIERAKKMSETFPNKPPFFADYRDVYRHADCALLSLPHHLHHSAGLDFLRAGKHVLMEKPLANTEAECLDLIKTAEETGKVLMVAYCMRFHPLVERLKELIDSKRYGDIFQLSIWTEQHTEAFSDWIKNASTLGGGQLFSHGCHYIDLMLWMLGKPLRGVHFGTNRGTPWMEREGTSNVTIEFENGLLGYHFGTWGARGSRLGYSFHAHCTEGMLEADIQKGFLAYHRNTVKGDSRILKEPEILLSAEAGKHTEREIKHFADCVMNGKKPLTDPRTSLESLRVIWKLYEAEGKHAVAELS
jgi:predicted dehydrogenase